MSKRPFGEELARDLQRILQVGSQLDRAVVEAAAAGRAVTIEAVAGRAVVEARLARAQREHLRLRPDGLRQDLLHDGW